jgi:hypothetical protein
MKKNYLCIFLPIISSLLSPIATFSQPQCYLQLYPGDNTKIIFQISPDKDYTNVAIYINFYDNGNDPIKLNKKFAITTNENKYLLASNGVYSYVLDQPFKNVDHISLGGIYEKVPALELQRSPQNRNFLDDGDKAADAGYAFNINAINSPNPLQAVSLGGQPIANDPCNTGGLLQLVNRNKVVRSSYKCNLEQNGEALDGDFWWSVDNPQTGAIVPQNGAKFFLLWNCPSCFDTITCRTLNDYDTRRLLTTNSISNKSLKPGNLIAYITRNNLAGIMRIENFVYGHGIDLRISFRTFRHN